MEKLQHELRKVTAKGSRGAAGRELVLRFKKLPNLKTVEKCEQVSCDSVHDSELPRDYRSV